MPHLPEFTTQWIAQYGNFALFVLLAIGILGLPIPDETLITFSGALVAQNKLPLIDTLITVFLGAVFGITLSYFLGRFIGVILLNNYGKYIGITPVRLQKTHQWFERVGKWTLFIGYFLPGIRHVTGIIAGSARLPYLQFALFAYSGALIWSQIFFIIGYYFSHNWQAIIHVVRYYAWMGGVLMVIALFLYAAWRFFGVKDKKN